MRTTKKSKSPKVPTEEAGREEPHVNLARLGNFTEVDIELMKIEDGEAGGDYPDPGYLVRSGPNPAREAREKLGLSQDEFAVHFGLSVRTLQQWEQARRVPDGPATVLLAVIAQEPNAVRRALKKSRPAISTVVASTAGTKARTAKKSSAV